MSEPSSPARGSMFNTSSSKNVQQQTWDARSNRLGAAGGELADKMHENVAAAQRMQIKSFTAWVNLQLAKVKLSR